VKKVLRSFLYSAPEEKDKAKTNLAYCRQDRLLNLNKLETEITDLIFEFFTNNAEAPAYQLVYDHFETAANTEAIQYLDEVSSLTFFEGSSFVTLFEQEVEDQAAANLVATAKEVIVIATQGLKTKTGVIKGTDAAVGHFFTSAKAKPPNETGRMKASMRENNQALTEMYEERKASPHNTYGIMTGLGIFDQATAGIKKKQFYIHAGYGGHLKSTTMMNMIVNGAVNSGWNMLLFTSEMPAEDVQQLMVAIHSANPIFNGQGRPLNAFRLLLGGLQPEEEEFYRMVKDDLLTNSTYGNIKVIDSGEFSTFGSVMQRTQRENAEEEVDCLWVDYITRLPVDAKYRGMDITSARNETLADAKRFGMQFNNGIGLPVCTPFQINRDGYKRMKANGGKMDLTCLANYNAAEKEADIVTYVYYDAEEQATSEPKVGVSKSRWGRVPPDPVSIFIEPDSRRMFDLTAGMSPASGYAPTKSGGMDDVEL